MNAGRLRKRVTIQEKGTTQGSFGEEGTTWTDVLDAWASVEPLSGREYLEARQTQADVTTRVVMRFQDGVAPEMRVKFGTRYFDILSVIHVEERGRELQLMCREQL